MDERTDEIVGRFQDSWTKTEEFYESLTSMGHWKKVLPIKDLIASLKKQGYDKYFRLGTSVYMLIISRSVEHGLRYDQKHIKISPCENGSNVSFREGDKVYREYLVDSLEDDRVTALLRTLKDTLVD